MLKDGLLWLSELAKADQKLGGPVLAMDLGTPFEPPTCDTFTWFRGCWFLVDPDLRRMDIYGAISKRRFQVSLDDFKFPLTGRTFPSPV